MPNAIQQMKTTPYAHQQKEFDLYKDAEARALLWQMRTGKTKAVIDNACYLYKQGKIKNVIIVAPNGVHLNWLHREIPAHHWDRTYYTAYAWRFSCLANEYMFGFFIGSAGNRLAWFMVNAESLYRDEVKAALKRVLQRGDTMVVFDEAHYFGHAGARRTAAARALARRAKYRRILTGTPIENSPLRAFSQFELLEKGALGHTTYQNFEGEFAVMDQRNGRNGGRYKVVRGYRNLPELRRRMAQYSSVVTRADCVDLPPIQRVVQEFELTPAQEILWRDLKTQNVETLLERGFDPLAGGALLTKLQQIEGGWLKTPDGVEALDNPKLDMLMDEIEDGIPTVVWAQYSHEIEGIYNEASMRGYRVAELYGVMPDAMRQEAIEGFQSGRYNVLVAQPKVGGQGYNLSRANRIIWYSQTADAVIHSQACERASLMGKTGVQIVSLIAPKGVDAYYADLCEDKISLADDISRTGLQKILEGLTL